MNKRNLTIMTVIKKLKSIKEIEKIMDVDTVNSINLIEGKWNLQNTEDNLFNKFGYVIERIQKIKHIDTPSMRESFHFDPYDRLLFSHIEERKARLYYFEISDKNLVDFIENNFSDVEILLNEYNIDKESYTQWYTDIKKSISQYS